MEQDFESSLLSRKEFSFPTNIKQMGNIDKQIKIYIEDYVYTYIYQYAKTGGSKEKLIILVGEHTYVNDYDVVLVSGAIQGKYSEGENGVQKFTEETWNYINEQMEKFFSDLCVLGWCHVQPEFGIFMMARDELFHKKCFKSKYQVFCTIDPMERQECFYTYNSDMSSLRPVKGYFIYYDKNERMQEYMLENSISKPKDDLVCDDEICENNKNENTKNETRTETKVMPKKIDRIDAASRIRKVISKKEEFERKTKRGKNTAFAAVTGALCAAFIFISINVAQSVERIHNLEKEVGIVKYSYDSINSLMEDTAAQVFAVKAEEEKRAAEEERKKLELEEQERKEQEEQKEEENKYDVSSIYTIKYGDTLWAICNNYYGSPEMLTTVMEINSITDGEKLNAGDRIVLPKKE